MHVLRYPAPVLELKKEVTDTVAVIQMVMVGLILLTISTMSLHNIATAMEMVGETTAMDTKVMLAQHRREIVSLTGVVVLTLIVMGIQMRTNYGKPIQRGQQMHSHTIGCNGMIAMAMDSETLRLEPSVMIALSTPVLPPLISRAALTPMAMAGPMAMVN